MLLYLNCNDTYAHDGHPGNSLGSPEGRAAKADADAKAAEEQEQAEAEAAAVGEQG